MKYSNLVPYMICEFTINDYNGINSIVKQIKRVSIYCEK